MKTYLNTTTGLLTTSAGSTTPLRSLTAKRGDRLDIEVIPDAAIVGGATGLFVAKPKGSYTGEPVALDAAWDAPAVSGAGYTFLVDLNTVELTALLTSSVASVELMAEITWTAGGVVRSTQTFALTVENDIWKGDEGVPTDALDPYPLPGDILTASDINDTVIGTDQLGAASGVATLDSGGKVPTGQLPDSVLGQVEYRGTWNANTNTPNLGTLNPAARKGDYFVVSVAGASDPDTAGRTWEPGDWLAYNGTTWDKVDNTEPTATDTLPGLIKKATAAQTNAQTLDDTAVTPRNLRSQTTANLAANLVLTASSDTRQILAPQTTNRDVTLPVINAAPTGDQVGYGHCYSIIHDGSVNSLLVKNSAAVDQVRIDPGESAWLCATSSGWLAVKTFRAGVVSIIFPGIDLTAAAGNTTLYTPVPGMQFLATSAAVRNDTVSGTISTPAQIQIDNGVDGQDIFANLTLTSPATGRSFDFAKATQPRIADSANPIRLRRTVAAAGTTPVHTGTIIIDGRLI
jgi:hypothetical protein